MTRADKIARLTSTAERLSDAQINVLVELSVAMTRPSVYASLPAEHKASIEQGIADYEAGRVVDADEVFAEIDKRLAAAET
jgi:predicted transcriptional regulator